MKSSPFAPVYRRSLSAVVGVLCALLPALCPWHASAQLAGFEVVGLGLSSNNRLTFTATIEGKNGAMVLDTGAGGSFLGEGKYGFLRPSADRPLPPGVPKSSQINGARVAVGYARDFHVGNSNLGALPLRLVPDRDLFEGRLLLAPEGGRQYDGYIGEDILRHFNAIIDAGRRGLYLNLDPKRRTNPGHALVTAGWTRVPMMDIGKDFAVECTLGKRQFRLIVDTGAPFTAIDDHIVRGAGVPVRPLPMKGGVIETHAQELALVETDTLTIGGYSATGVHMISEPGMAGSLHANLEQAAPLAGLLGVDILMRHHALIDIGNSSLYLKP